ncbi:hypothetical protein EBB07_15235 [Paenibacillaceae bacterium]|nr:hypothetical protein EBB07_15235 [Paenibacillaceae bacterium]
MTTQETKATYPAKITGIVPALVTPFDDKGDLILASAEKLIAKYVKERADGLYMLGYTGEGWCMSMEERKAWTEAVLKANAGQIPVIVHVGYGSLDEALELTKHAVRHGAYATSSVPLSNSATMQDNTVYFRAIAEASEVPFYIYWNQEIVDSDTGRRPLASKLADELLACRNIGGIKYTDSNFYYLERIRKYKPELNLLTGVDSMVNAGALLGADGAIGLLQSVTCGHMRTMWDAYQAGDLERAHQLQIRANNLYEMLDRPEIGVIAGAKAILAHEGIEGLPKQPSGLLSNPALVKELLDVYQANIVN